MNSNDRFDCVKIDSRDGVRLTVRRWGPRDAQPIVFLHGSGQTSWSWEASARSLAEQGFYCLAPDFRGHGDSEWAEHYDLDHFADDVRSVVDQLCHQPPITVGASLGGAAALVVEGESDDACLHALALVDITPRWETEGASRILAFLTAHPDGFHSLAAAAEAIRNYLPHRTRPTSHEGLRKNLRHRDNGRWYWHWDPKIVANAVEAADRIQPRLESAARQVGIPTLLVSGSESDVVSEHTIAEFLEQVPHAEHIVIDDAHHMVAGDRNDRFTEALTRFLGLKPRLSA